MHVFPLVLPMSRQRMLAALLCLLLLACATPPAPELLRGRELAAAGRTEDAVKELDEAVKRRPDDIELRALRLRQRELLQAQWLAAADAAAQGRQPDAARSLYERVLGVDAGNRRAQAGLDGLRLRAELDTRVQQGEAALSEGRMAEAETLLRGVLAEDAAHAEGRRAMARLREKQMNADATPPALKSALATGISLELRDVPLRNAFDVISKTAQLNFVFDRDVRADARVTLTVRNSPVNDVIRLLLLTQQLDRKVLNENSLLIYPATQPKQREYQDLVARVFFLTNADAKQAQTLLRALGKTREVHVDEKLNLIAIRDTADAVRLAERLVEAIDVAEPEVMLEVEVLEISRSRAMDLGIQFPTEVRVESPLTSRINLRNSDLSATIANPALRIGLQSSDGNTTLLANPRIRAKNREKARVLIGEKLPVFTTSSVANAATSTSVSYLDVGLKLEVEPTVYLDNEVGIKVNLEVSSNLERIVSTDGSTAFRLGTRTAQTNLRLRDGETQVLAGLINDSDRESFSKVPGLGELPGIGRAFGNTVRNRDKSEIVLLITPRVLRNIVPPDLTHLVFGAGTEAAAGAPPLLISPTAPRALAMSSNAGTGRSVVPTPGANATAAVEAPTPAPPPNAFVAQLRAPSDVSIGRDFTVVVEIADAGTAQQAEVILEVDASLLSGAGPRPVVRLVPGGAGNSLVGSLSLRAAAAGTGATTLRVVGGSVRTADGQQSPVSGGGTSLRIGI
jgi:general secretion pathway protein D